MTAFQIGTGKLVLASASQIRAEMLKACGLVFDIRPSSVDEPTIKEALKTERGALTGDDLAAVLAQTKAVDVSTKDPSGLVIGADQVLSLDGKFYDKPVDRDDARNTLTELRGKTHLLHTAVACASAGEVVWHHEASVALTMRDFSNEFLGLYMADCGDGLLTSVGAYKLEGSGAQLFDRIEGDYFSVLGLPLLELLGFLRTTGAISS